MGIQKKLKNVYTVWYLLTLKKTIDGDPKKIKAGRKKSTHTKTALVIYVILDIFVIFFMIAFLSYYDIPLHCILFDFRLVEFHRHVKAPGSLGHFLHDALLGF